MDHGPSGLTVTVGEVDDEALVALAGELDMATVGDLDGAVESLTAAGCRRVVLDCAELSFCDSTGLQGLLRSRARLDAAAGVLVLRSVPDHLRRLLDLTDLSGEFPTD